MGTRIHTPRPKTQKEDSGRLSCPTSSIMVVVGSTRQKNKASHLGKISRRMGDVFLRQSKSYFVVEMARKLDPEQE